MLTSELIDLLTTQAREIATEGHAGWGNTMAEAAETLRKYEGAMDAIYNHNEAARAAVIQHFGLWHMTSNRDFTEFCKTQGKAD